LVLLLGTQSSLLFQTPSLESGKIFLTLHLVLFIMVNIPTVDLEAESHENISHADEVADYSIIDLDAHYNESYETIAEYMEEPWRTRLLGSDWIDSGQKQNQTSYFPQTQGDRLQYGKITRDHSSYPTGPANKQEILDAEDFLGLDIQVQISHSIIASSAVNADDKRVEQFFRGWVEYQINEVLDPDEGVYGLTPVTPTNVDAALDMIDTAAEEDGFVAPCIITSGTKPLLGNRKWDVLYERCEDHGLPVVLHTGGAGLDTPQYAGARSFVETHTLGFLQSNQNQLASIVFQGIPERYDIDFCLLESGVTYLPGLMARMDEEYLKRSEEAPMLEKKPSEYLTDFYFGTQPLETEMDIDFLEKCFDIIGTENIMYASDYPHWDYDQPTTITNLSFLDEEDKQRILADNAREVFDFD
jgi:predicted TIM-barrel fold metal-dependent hydrolase